MRTTEARVWFEPDEPGRFLPEGPRVLTLVGRPYLVWVNIQTDAEADHGHVFLRPLDAPDPPRVIACPGRPGFVLPLADGNRVLAGVGHDLRILDCQTGNWEAPQATVPDAHPRTIINDAEVLPGGRAVVFGTKDTRFQDPIAALYLYTPDDHRVTLLAGGQLCSNGKVIRDEGGSWILYDIDTPTRTVVRYRLDVTARTAEPLGVAIDVSGIDGLPDGMCDCGDGTVIVAFYNPEPAAAGAAVRFDLATGQPRERWVTPGSPRVTCPVLVRQPDGIKLILTTATEGMPQEQRAACPNAGKLFIADTDLPACPEPEAVRLGS